jgi:glycosyltransferase involved in cell wall biosynthesis
LKDEFVVGGCGLTTWRKGADLFIQLAAAINRLKPNNNIKLFWTGNNGKEFMNQYEYEEERLAITDKLFFIGQKSVPANYFQVFDVFALTSREDPFPLVVLEAASQNKPVICFENSGGIPELIANNKGGVTVPYGNVEEMAKQIIHLQEQPEKLTLMGIEAGGLVEKFDVDVIGRQLVIIINDYLTK